MGEKNSQNRKQLRGWHEARSMNLQENGPRFLEKSLSRSSKPENDDEKHRHELLRYSGRMNNEGVAPTMKRVIRSWRNELTDDNSFLRQTWKRI